MSTQTEFQDTEAPMGFKIRIRAYAGARGSGRAPTFIEGSARYSIRAAVESLRDRMREIHGPKYYAIRAIIVSGPAKQTTLYPGLMNRLQTAQHKVRDARILSAQVFDDEIPMAYVDADGQVRAATEVFLEQPHTR